MRAGSALALTLIVAFGGLVGLQIAGPGPGDAIDDADRNDSTAAEADEQAADGREEGDAKQGAGPVNETDVDPPKPQANLTLAGPEHLETDTEGTFHGHLLVGGEPLHGRAVELHVDGELAARAETNASGGYEAALAFAAEGEHRVRAASVNLSLAVANATVNVTVTAPEPVPVLHGWSMFRGDPARTGARTTDGPGEGSVVWELDTELDVRHEPAVAGGTVFVGTSGLAGCCRPTFRAVDAATGEPIWSTAREDGFGFPVVHDDRVLVGAGSELLALDAGNGTELWSRSVDPIPGVAPAVEANTSFTIETSGEATAVSARRLATGEQLWRQQLGGEPGTSPAVVNGTVYVGLGSTMYALDAATGTVAWTHEGDGAFVASPAIADGGLFTVSLSEPGRGDVVYGLDASSGDELWTNTIDGPSGGAIAVHGGELFVPSVSGWLYSFDASNGHYGLNTSLGDDDFAAPAVTDGTVYLAGREGTIMARDADSGAELWSVAVADEEEEETAGMPTVVDGRLFVGVDDDCLGCLDTGLVALDAGEPTVERG